MTTIPSRPEQELKGKRALVVGGGQTPGSTIGNGRATALLFAREGARVVVADRHFERADETAQEILAAGGEAYAVASDIADAQSVASMVAFAHESLGGIDLLHNNVGVSLAGGDAVISEIEMDAFDRVIRINLSGMVATCRHTIPLMQAQGGGSITCVGSVASLVDTPMIAYKTSKAGVVALVQHIAIRHAPDGIRANAILPGLMETPMAIENRVGIHGQSKEDLIRERDSHVPLRGRQGTGWDVAEAAVFLSSDRARFITGASLPVDGGQALRAG
ncbi:SDR family NAD(P)-dependent oxidoreductase [Sinomonas sp. G460-2]|uniref:SDR family NAD(P)-dependent oxidoreductase n=1 Tax=Sinomonas sp. G460-2 TaxID=3393464 RepID=UPI0039EE9BBC